MRCNQPQTGPALLNGTPCAYGLRSFVTPSISLDLARRARSVTRPTTGVTVVDSPVGKLWQGSATYGGVSIGATGGVGTIVDQTKAFSWFARVFMVTGGSPQIIIGDFDVSGNVMCFNVKFSTGGSITLESYTGSSYPVTSSYFVGNGWHDIEVEITTSPTYTQTLSAGEADSITDYTALRMRFTEV